MKVFSAILGAADAPEYHETLHHLEHHHAVDVVRLTRADLARRRLRTQTQAGQDVAIALPRDQQLFDGAVLEMDGTSAVVVRVEAEEWLRFAPSNPAAALRLGYFCGNFHWRVRFEKDHLLIAVDTEAQTYLERLEALLAEGGIVQITDSGATR